MTWKYRYSCIPECSIGIITNLNENVSVFWVTVPVHSITRHLCWTERTGVKTPFQKIQNISKIYIWTKHIVTNKKTQDKPWKKLNTGVIRARSILSYKDNAKTKPNPEHWQMLTEGKMTGRERDTRRNENEILRPLFKVGFNHLSMSANKKDNMLCRNTRVTWLYYEIPIAKWLPYIRNLHWNKTTGHTTQPAGLSMNVPG